MRTQLFVGTKKGAFLYSSDSARESWKMEGPLFPGWSVSAVARDGAGGFVAATSSDIYGPCIQRSPNLREWKIAEKSPKYSEKSGFKFKQVWTFAALGNSLLAGVDEAGVFRSDDHGETWSELKGLSSHETRSAWFPGFGGLCAHHLITDGKDKIWCGISAVGVLGSKDAGKSWVSLNQGVPVLIKDENFKGIGTCVHAIQRDPENSQRIWRQDHVGMFRSEDGGESWESIQEGLPSTFGFPLVVDKSTRTLFCCPLDSDEKRYPPNGELRIYRSTNGGDSWKKLSCGLPSSSYHAVLRQAMAVDNLSGEVQKGGVYFGNAAGEVYASNDLGDHWQRLQGSLPRVLFVEAFVS
jgi:hypothetical protein